MYPIRLSARRLFVPGYGILPYIRGLQVVLRKNGFSFRTNVNGAYKLHTVIGDDFSGALLNALEELERNSDGVLRTCRNFVEKERVDKKTPTGHVGVYWIDRNNNNPYRVTCPSETNEATDSLRVAALIREQASEEFLRKNTFTLDQVLSGAGL